MSNQLHEIYGPGFSEMSACRWKKQAHPPAAIPCYHGISNRDASCARWEDAPEPCHPGLSCCSAGTSGWAKSHESAGAFASGYGPMGPMASGDASGSCPMRRGGQCPFGAAGSADGSMASPMAAGASCGMKHAGAGAMACPNCPLINKAAGAMTCSSCRSQ